MSPILLLKEWLENLWSNIDLDDSHYFLRQDEIDEVWGEKEIVGNMPPSEGEVERKIIFLYPPTFF